MRRFSIDDMHNTMGNHTRALAVKDNVTCFDRGRFDGLDSDEFILLDGRIHAAPTSAKTYTLALPQQVFTQVCEEMDGSEGAGGWRSLFEHINIVPCNKLILQGISVKEGIMKWWNDEEIKPRKHEDRNYLFFVPS
jgi:hypothetical protein